LQLRRELGASAFVLLDATQCRLACGVEEVGGTAGHAHPVAAEPARACELPGEVLDERETITGAGLEDRQPLV
jgi:hypothetical protein